MTEALAHGYSSESTISEGYLMNTNMTRFGRISQKSLHPCVF